MAGMTLRLLTSDAPDLAAVLRLIRSAFASMDGVIDPPSSAQLMTQESLRAEARSAEVWVIGDPVIACVILTPQADTLYLGKLAVEGAARGCGHARRLVALARDRARALHLPSVTLQTRVELTGNHAAFRALGFLETGRTRHPGYPHDTSITFTLMV